MEKEIQFSAILKVPAEWDGDEVTAEVEEGLLMGFDLPVELIGWSNR